MKALIVLLSLIAFSQGKPGWAYSSVDLTSPAYVGVPVVAAASPVISVPQVISADPVLTAPAVVEAKTVETAPVITVARTVETAPVVTVARTVETAPVVTVARTVETAPVINVARTVVATAPAVIKTQYHAQDELGQASYGHTEPLQSHAAVQDVTGNKVGSFSYLNPNDGLIHRTDYVADALGYRVASNDLPVGPSGPVVDTPEVAIAKAAHLEAVSKARARREVVVAAGHTPASTAPLLEAVPALPLSAITTYTAAAPIASISTPAAISYANFPAVREATITTIVNTPGHAVSYRVD